MVSNPSQVIVLTEGQPFNAAHGLSVHHRDFPEVSGRGNSPGDAAGHLVELLSRTLDSAPSDWRKGMLEHAIEDVKAFVKRDHAETASASFEGQSSGQAEP